jgi:hypothetical protein
MPSWLSSWRMRWLTALGVTASASPAAVTLRRRARASKASRHWMGGMRGGVTRRALHGHREHGEHPV